MWSILIQHNFNFLLTVTTCANGRYNLLYSHISTSEVCANGISMISGLGLRMYSQQSGRQASLTQSQSISCLFPRNSQLWEALKFYFQSNLCQFLVVSSSWCQGISMELWSSPPFTLASIAHSISITQFIRALTVRQHLIVNVRVTL